MSMGGSIQISVKVCAECNGSKNINIGALREVMVPCSFCHGSGKCSSCNGSGDIWVQDNTPLW